MYLYGEYFKANVYTIWVHGPLGYVGRYIGESMIIRYLDF